MIHSAVFLGLCVVAKTLKHWPAGVPAEVRWKCHFGMEDDRGAEQHFNIAVGSLPSSPGQSTQESEGDRGMGSRHQGRDENNQGSCRGFKTIC